MCEEEEREEGREGGEDEGDIYEEPDRRMTTVIHLSQNEAYVLSQQFLFCYPLTALY